MVCLPYKLVSWHLIRVCPCRLSKEGEIEVRIKLQFGDSQATSWYSTAFEAACARRAALQSAHLFFRSWSGSGPPLIHMKFVKFIEIMTRRGVRTRGRLYTNLVPPICTWITASAATSKKSESSSSLRRNDSGRARLTPARTLIGARAVRRVGEKALPMCKLTALASKVLLAYRFWTPVTWHGQGPAQLPGCRAKN